MNTGKLVSILIVTVLNIKSLVVQYYCTVSYNTYGNKYTCTILIGQHKQKMIVRTVSDSTKFS